MFKNEVAGMGRAENACRLVSRRGHGDILLPAARSRWSTAPWSQMYQTEAHVIFVETSSPNQLRNPIQRRALPSSPRPSPPLVSILPKPLKLHP